jgi:hypothetical protein
MMKVRLLKDGGFGRKEIIGKVFQAEPETDETPLVINGRELNKSNPAVPFANGYGYFFLSSKKEYEIINEAASEQG